MAGPRRRFVTLDVFTERRLAGNPLAVVLDTDGLDAATMQAIASEFNLSETVFVQAPADARHRASLRIFTPSRELPFAGHPTVGAAVLLALQEPSRVAPTLFDLEEGIGVVPCVVETLADGGGGRARFRLPALPVHLGPGPDPEVLAPLLGIEVGDVRLGRHAPTRFEAGPCYTCVPIASVAALDAARPAQAPQRGDGLYLYTPDPDDGDPEGRGRSWRVRMFAPDMGVQEDAATGSAAAAFAGVLTRFEALADGPHRVSIRQGQAMGRPSAIALELTVEAGALRSVEIGGAAVIVSDGNLRVL